MTASSGKLIELKEVGFTSCVLVQDFRNGTIFAVHHSGKVLKYCCKNDEWVHLHNKSQMGSSNWWLLQSHIAFMGEAACINTEQNIIYIFRNKTDCTNPCVLMYNITEPNAVGVTFKEFPKITAQYGDAGDARAVVINNECHIIGNGGHYKIDIEGCKIETQHLFLETIWKEAIQRPAVVQVDSSKVLMFGGCDDDDGEELKGVHRYSVDSDQWETLDGTEMPYGMSEFGACSVLDGKMVLLFDNNKNKIHIYNVKDQQFSTSRYEIERDGPFKAFSVHDREKDELAVTGYCRDRWELEEHVFPPQYLLKIMIAFYWNEHIHLINTLQGTNYKIDLYEII